MSEVTVEQFAEVLKVSVDTDHHVTSGCHQPGHQGSLMAAVACKFYAAYVRRRHFAQFLNHRPGAVTAAVVDKPDPAVRTNLTGSH